MFLRQLVNFALSRKMVDVDPLAGLNLKKPKPTRQPCWTAGEVAKILAAAPPEVRPALTLLAETGMRFGELQWLTWDDIKLNGDESVLYIRPKDAWRPKSGDQRTIPLSPVAGGPQHLAIAPADMAMGLDDAAILGLPQVGRQWTERRLLAALKAILKPLGLAGKLHTFRPYFISNALLNMTPEAMVRKWVGRVDAKILETYTHMSDPDSQAAMLRLSEAKSSLQVKKVTGDGQEGNSAQI